jgi:hypothetical protein
MTMGAEAACGWILNHIERGKPVPPPSPIEAVKPDEGGFATLLVLDLDGYSKKYGRNTVVKNLDIEIPAYLDTFAESQRLDLSKVMQDSLNDLYQRQHAQV